MDDELLCLTFCTTTETNRAEEALFVAGCIMNRVRAGYRGKTVREVVLANMQFSAFNHDSAQRQALENSDPYIAVAAYLAKHGESAQRLFDEFLEVCSGVYFQPDLNNPWINGQVEDARADAVWHYFSEISMRPRGSKPGWFDASKEVLVPQISSERFRWFAGVH